MANKFFGLDIGSSTIKLVELSTNGKTYSLVSYGMVPTPPSGIYSESEIDQKALSQVIANLAKDSKVNTNMVVTSLPEAQVSTKVVTMPVMSDNEVASAIKWEAEQYVPWPIADVSLDWQILSRPEKTEKGTEGKMEVLLVAAPTALVNKYVKILKMANLEIIGVETELVAMARSLIFSDQSAPPSLIVSIGAMSTSLCIVSGGLLVFTRSIATGGIALARAVATELGIDPTQAEEYKKSYGLDKSQLSGKVMMAIKPIFDVIVNEIKRAFSFYQDLKPKESIKRLVVCGGSAKLPGLVVYLASEAGGVEVAIADPWKNIAVSEKLSNQVREDAPLFATVVGLAMKEF